MLACLLALVLQPGASHGSTMTTAELRALAEEHENAERFVEAGEAYLELARRSDARPRDALLGAHTNFDSAFIASGDARRLCRALQIAERVVREGGFENDEQAKFWSEVVEDDLARLAEDAKRNNRANCRFDAAGQRRRPVMLLADDTPVRIPAEHVESPVMQSMPRGTTTRDGRRTRARTAVGGTLLGLGLGFIGLTTGAAVTHGIQLAALDRLRDRAPAHGGLSDAERSLVSRLRADALESRAAAIGLGAAAVATFIPGVVLLARRHQSRRRGVAFVPYGGPRGAGAVLRLNF